MGDARSAPLSPWGHVNCAIVTKTGWGSRPAMVTKGVSRSSSAMVTIIKGWREERYSY